MDIEKSLSERLLQAALEGEKTKKETTEKENANLLNKQKTNNAQITENNFLN